MYPQIWPTKPSFFNWLRGAIRRSVWQRYPPKIVFKNKHAFPPPPGLVTKARKVGKCALTGELQAISKMEVDHVYGNVGMTDWRDVTPFIMHLCGGEYQLVTKEAHKIKSYAERMNISFDRALTEKKAIDLIKKKIDRQWLKQRGILPASSQVKRREQLVAALMESNE